MRNRLTIRQQFMLLLAGVGLVVISVFARVLYTTQRQALISGIDARLHAVAIMARETLPCDYHDRISGSGSVNDNEFQEIVERYNRICVTLGLEYIWSLMEIDGRIVFTSSTSPDKVVANRNHAQFFEIHSAPELYFNAFETMRPIYKTNVDKWGRIRVALIPWTDGQGRKYLFGSSVTLADVERQLRVLVGQSLGAGVFLFALILLLGLWGSHPVTRPIKRLTATIEAIAEGKSLLLAEETGAREVAILARCFNRLNRALQGEIMTLETSRARLIGMHEEERRQAEEELYSSEQRYRGILNFAVDGILIGTHEGIITEANMTMCELFGMSRDELIGRHISEMPFTSESVAKNPFRFDLLQKGERVISERVVRHRDGREVTIEMHTKMMPDGSYQSIYHDITERKKEQALLETLNQTLERRVEARTSEVNRYAEQLKALTERLTRVEEDERQRIADILHEDLQQILVAARMTLNAARQHVKGVQVKEMLSRTDSMIEQSVGLTRSLVQDIAVPAVREGDVPAAVRWIAQQMKEKFDLTVELEADEDVETVNESTYLCLYRAIQEIFFNAVKHAKVTHVHVRIQKASPGWIRVVVLDGGSGFVQLRSNGRDGTVGNGIGLFGIRQRVEGLGGTLCVESEFGVGTSVELTLPVSDNPSKRTPV